MTADKYLLPELSRSADHRFRHTVTVEEDVDQVHCIIQAIREETSHDEGMMEMAETLRKKHLAKLVLHPPYRAYLETDMPLLWRHFEELALGASLAKKHVVMCSAASHDMVAAAEPYGNYRCRSCARGTYSSASSFSPGDQTLSAGQQVWVLK